VLATQIAESGALNSFATSAEQLAAQLKSADPDLRRLIIAGPQVGAQVADLLADTNPGLAVLVANLLTTSEVTLTRGQALDELLSVLPADIAAGSTVITSKGANFGMALTFFSPLPCTAGYGGTVYRNGLDTSPAPPVNTSAACTLPASSGVDVRGSANAPSGGGVPAAAQPGLAKLLGVTP
jgi:phospholipid/cholesterol/gamma-HCH transport system substrate-binding protein